MSSSKSSKQSRSTSSRFNGGGDFRVTASLTGKNDSFKITQATSGNGCLSTQNTGISIAEAQNVRIDPFSIGSRAGLMGNLFAQWRVKRMVIQYITDESVDGMVDTVAGPTTTPSRGSRAFAIGWNRDPDIAYATYDAVIEMGGFAGNTSRNSRPIVVRGSGWLWASTSSASPSGIDQRMACFGQLSACFRQNSSTAAATYGRVIISYDLQFRYPAIQSVLGLQTPSTQPQPLLKVEQEEKDGTMTSSLLSDSFMLIRKKK